MGEKRETPGRQGIGLLDYHLDLAKNRCDPFFPSLLPTKRIMYIADMLLSGVLDMLELM